MLSLLIFKESPVDVSYHLLMYWNTFCFRFPCIPTYQDDCLFNSPKSIKLKSNSLIYLELIRGALRNSWTTLYSLFYNVKLFSSDNFIYHLKALVFELIDINLNKFTFNFANLWILSEHLHAQDIVDHLHLSHMPVKVVFYHSLLSFNKPSALSEIVISHILT